MSALEKIDAELNEQFFQDGIDTERKRVIEILENNWLMGTVSRRIIDDVIKQINDDVKSSINQSTTNDQREIQKSNNSNKGNNIIGRPFEEIQEDIRTLRRVPSEFIDFKLDELAEELELIYEQGSEDERKRLLIIVEICVSNATRDPIKFNKIMKMIREKI